MRILSFDVGIKNLAWCLTETKQNEIENQCCWKILDWGVWDLRIDIEDAIYHPEFCYANTASGKICGKAPMYSDISDGVCLGGLCKIHAKHSTAICTGDEIKGLSRLGIETLREKARSMQLNVQGMRKKEIIDCISIEFKKRCLVKIPKLQHAKRMSIENIHDRIRQRIQDIHCSADVILIENQPVRINATMKTVQMILWTTLRDTLLSNGVSNPVIKFINANKKLMVYPDTHEPSPWYCHILGDQQARSDARQRNYNDRKKESVSRVQSLLEMTHQDIHLRWFNHNPKNDDLADCLLMCLYHHLCV
jgi:acetolactate synthase small subunit